MLYSVERDRQRLAESEGLWVTSLLPGIWDFLWHHACTSGMKRNLCVHGNIVRNAKIKDGLSDKNIMIKEIFLLIKKLKWKTEFYCIITKWFLIGKVRIVYYSGRSIRFPVSNRYLSLSISKWLPWFPLQCYCLFFNFHY